MHVYGFGLTQSHLAAKYFVANVSAARARESALHSYDAEHRIVAAMANGSDVALIEGIQLAPLTLHVGTTTPRSAFPCFDIPSLGCVPTFLLERRHVEADSPLEVLVLPGDSPGQF